MGKKSINSTVSTGALRKNTVQDLIKGTLMGGACGDAFGMPYEGLSALEIKNNFKVNGSYENSTMSIHTKGQPKGAVTDDTQLNFATIESILENKRVDIEDIGLRFVDLYKHKNLIGAGRGTQLAIKKILKGASAYQAGLKDAYGCGAAMRIAPIAVLPETGRDAEELIANVTYITHNNSVGLASAMAVAFSIKYLMTPNSNVDDSQYKKQFLEMLESWSNYESPNQELNFSRKVNYLRNNFNANIDNLAVRIGTSGLATESTIYAIASFLKEPRDFEKLMIQSVRNGGDTDSIASIAGNLFGAYNGMSAIPNRFLINLRNHREMIKKVSQYAELILK